MIRLHKDDVILIADSYKQDAKMYREKETNFRKKGVPQLANNFRDIAEYYEKNARDLDGFIQSVKGDESCIVLQRIV